MSSHLIIFSLILFSITIECKLKGVFLVMRHAKRGPSSPYPSDPNILDRYPNGLSQLTELGIEQAVNIGEYIRDRYRGFYLENPKNSLLRSSNDDRCIDTMALVSGQLWPPNGKRDWIQPRIFRLPMPFDGTLSENAYCPNSDIDSDNNLNKPEVIAFNEEHQWLYNYVSYYTGLPATMSGTVDAYDVLRSDKSNGLHLPEWATDCIFNKMGFIYFKYYDFIFSSKLTFKLNIGLLLKELSKRMEEVLRSSLAKDRYYKNFFIYSTHDFEIFGLNKALGIQQTTTPPFGAILIFELHEMKYQKGIKIFYINKTESLPIEGIQVKPSFCLNNCPYCVFKSSISNFFPNWKTDCGIPDDFDYPPLLEEWLTITNSSTTFKPKINQI